MTRTTKLFAVLTAVVLLATCLPLSVFGTQEELPASDISQLTAMDKIDPDDIIVKETFSFEGDPIPKYVEEESRREENVKHFSMPNGTYTAVVYPTAVHRKDADGVWQDINNDLSQRSVRGTQKYETADSRVSFAQGIYSDTALMTLSENGYTVAMTLLEDNNGNELSTASAAKVQSAPVVTNAEKKEPQLKDVTFEQIAKVDNKSSIVYSDVKQNTDIEYILDGNDVKENIIVKAVSSAYDYSFALKLTGLAAKLESDGSISLSDTQTGVIKYRIPAPFMYDADGEVSYAVEYSLTSSAKGAYILTVSADKAWINARGRAFPITIDPTIVPEVMMEDTYVSSSSPDDNYLFEPDLLVGSGYTALMKLYFPTLPEASSINEAYLYFRYYFSPQTVEGIWVGAYQITSFWSEEFATYNHMPSISPNCMSLQMLMGDMGTETDPYLVQLSITSAARNWFNDPDSNNGIAIMYESGIGTARIRSYETGLDTCEFISVNYSFNLPDGVYALENVSATGKWLTVESPDATADIEVTSSTEIPISAFDRTKLFKITRYGTTERYVIRTMLDNRVGFGVEDGAVVLKRLPSADSAVSEDDTFYITLDYDKCTIIPYCSSTYALGVTSSSASQTSLLHQPNVNDTSTIKWFYRRYVGITRSEITYSVSGQAFAGSSLLVQASSWSTIADANVLAVNAASGFSNKVSISWSDLAQMGLITLLQSGTVNMSIDICDGYYYTSLYSKPFSFTVHLSLEEGMYYIKNVGNGDYVQIHGTPKNGEGQAISTGDFVTDDYQKWVVVHNGEGYYRIQSYSSFKVFFLQGATDESTSIVQYTFMNNNPQMLWKFEMTDDGSFIIRPKSAEGQDTDWCVSVSDGGYLIQSEYTSDTDMNFQWKLYQCKYQYYVDHYYDEGLEARANNINADAGASLVAAQNIVAQLYMELFNLEIIPTYTRYTSATDLCRLEQHAVVANHLLAEPCPHSPSHLTADCLIADVGSGDPTQTNAIWTGHLLEGRSSSYANYYTVLIMPWLSNPNDTAEDDQSIAGLDEPSELVDTMARKLFHELGHQLGTFDHYCYEAIDVDIDTEDDDPSDNVAELPCGNDFCDECVNGLDDPRTCIMSNTDASVVAFLDADSLCSDCKVLIKVHLINHH